MMCGRHLHDKKCTLTVNERKLFVGTGKIFTRNTLTQASKNGRKPYLVLQKKFISVFYAINIFNTIYYFKPTNFNCA